MGKNENSKKISEWIILVIFLIICLPIIIAFFPIFIIELFHSPFERIKFKKSGYDKFYPRYLWGITRTSHYKIYEALKKQGSSFEYELYTENDNEQVIFILKKYDEYNLILCNDKDSLEFSEDKNEWVFCYERNYGQGFVEELSFPFQILEFVGERRYPKTKKNYFICLYKRITSYKRSNSKESKKLLQQDNRFVKLFEVLTLTD